MTAKTTLSKKNIYDAVRSYCRNTGTRSLDIKAALIDMDGVLYDSMPNHAKAWSQLCGELGIDAQYDEFFLYEGMTGTAIINLLYERSFGYGVSNEEARAIYAKKAEYFHKLDAGKPMPGAAKMLNVLKRNGIERVLVTGSGQRTLIDKLAADYPGIFMPEMQITAADVRHGKPDPEPYIMGMAKADTLPQQSLVIENAPLGVRAAAASGAFTIAVATGPIPMQDLADAGANIVFASMEECATMLPALIKFAREFKLDTKQELIFSNNTPAAITRAIAQSPAHNKIFIITDSNVHPQVLGNIATNRWHPLSGAKIIEVPAGESNKSLSTLEQIWNSLVSHGATRKSLVVNIGGGVITDMGGFAAATFKRGMSFINIPTTLLAAVDAAVGGKTGVNFAGLKNEIGVFCEAESVVIGTDYMSSLPASEIKSGFAEMLKHALLSSPHALDKLLAFPLNDIDFSRLLPLLADSVQVKRRIVLEDPHEQGLRRALNLGHTAGHAFESIALERKSPVPHGYAVAWGLVVELILSHMKCGFPSEMMYRVAEYICTHYGAFHISCDDYPHIIELMRHDKKSEHGELNFSLLTAVGAVKLGCDIARDDVEAALDIYRDLLHI